MKKGTAFSLAMFVAVLALLHVSVFAQKEASGKLTSVKGSVTIQAAGQPAAKAASNGMEVHKGDIIKTAGGASAIVRFADGSMVKVGPLSSMTISKATGEGGKSTSLDMSSGKMWARVTKKDKNSSFTVKTPTAIAGVRGTYYSSEVDKGDTSKFNVFDGEVAVSSVDNPEEEILVKANQTTKVEAGKSPTAPAAIPKEELKEESNGFTESEFSAATFDVQVDVSPATVPAGGKAVVTVRILKDGEPFLQEVPLRLKLGGSAVFVSNNKSELDIKTTSAGIASAEITSSSEENITVDVSLKLQMKKKKEK